jgi:hypothetical protein
MSGWGLKISVLPRAFGHCLTVAVLVVMPCSARAQEGLVTITCQEARGGDCFNDRECRPNLRPSKMILMMTRIPRFSESNEGILQECVEGEACGRGWSVNISSNTLTISSPATVTLRPCKLADAPVRLHIAAQLWRR